MQLLKSMTRLKTVTKKKCFNADLLTRMVLTCTFKRLFLRGTQSTKAETAWEQGWQNSSSSVPSSP